LLATDDPRHIADALAFALRFHGRKRVHSADEIMAEIVAKRLVRTPGAFPALSS
jgi:hypothetical protein